MAISSLGVGSGLDLNTMLTSLMTVEKQPLLALQKKEASYQSRISSLGTLNSALSSLQTAAKAFIPSIGQSANDKFATLKSTVTDTTLASATVSAGAAATTYALTNISLATNEQIRKTGFVIPTTDGTLSIKVGSGTAVDVNVKGASSLADIAKAINDATTGVSASIINNGTADYLVLSANDTGLSKQITITGSDSPPLSTPSWSQFNFSPPGATIPDPNDWTEQQAAKSASVDINGLTIASETNTISSAISNVTLTLTKESVAGTTLTVSKETTSSLSSALTGFIKAYNEATTSMKKLGYYNADTKVAGALQGDSSLRGAQNQVRSLLQTQPGGTSVYQTLTSIGVTLEKDGTLKLDSAKLSAAVTADYAGVTNLVSSLGTALNKGIEGLVGVTGTIAGATANTSTMIKELDKRAATLSLRLTQIEARYKRQFSSLDGLIASMNKTSTYLTQQLANLPGVTSSSKN